MCVFAGNAYIWMHVFIDVMYNFDMFKVMRKKFQLDYIVICEPNSSASK